jgi:hypothetical protein
LSFYESFNNGPTSFHEAVSFANLKKPKIPSWDIVPNINQLDRMLKSRKKVQNQHSGINSKEKAVNNVFFKGGMLDEDTKSVSKRKKLEAGQLTRD